MQNIKEEIDDHVYKIHASKKTSKSTSPRRMKTAKIYKPKINGGFKNVRPILSKSPQSSQFNSVPKISKSSRI